MTLDSQEAKAYVVPMTQTDTYTTWLTRWTEVAETFYAAERAAEER